MIEGILFVFSLAVASGICILFGKTYRDYLREQDTDEEDSKMNPPSSGFRGFPWDKRNRRR